MAAGPGREPGVSGVHTVLVLLAGPVMLGLLGFWAHVHVEALEHKMWPRGLRWFPDAWFGLTGSLYRGVLRVFWPEKRALYKSRAVLRLESYDQQWRLWAGTSEGGVPQWQAGPGALYGRWAPRPRPCCPCGYGTECAIWCGSGHADGGWVFATDGTGWQLREPSCPGRHS